MQTIKLTIEYDGTNFKGWQVQAKGERTVQGEIKRAFSKAFKEKINLIGSGRTDSGVHAFGQVASFQTSVKKDPQQIQNALNAYLDEDVVIKEARKVKEKFHAQFDAKKKTYRYRILNRSVRSPHLEKYAYRFAHVLNFDLMKKEIQSLKGSHDFRAFQASDASRKGDSTIRTIYDVRLRQKVELIEFDITGSGFLYKMVRNIVGTLISIGSGKLPPGSMKSILAKKSRKYAGPTAKAQGLYLMKVQY